MADNIQDDRQSAERRAFLRKCGRFAVVTPPVVTLMLTVSDKAKAQLTTSGKTSTPPTTSRTTSITMTTTATTVPTRSTTTSTTTHITMLMNRSSDMQTRVAMMVDSMGVMKL